MRDEARPFSSGRALRPGELLAENILWSYVIQLSSVASYVHTLGLACRCACDVVTSASLETLEYIFIRTGNKVRNCGISNKTSISILALALFFGVQAKIIVKCDMRLEWSIRVKCCSQVECGCVWTVLALSMSSSLNLTNRTSRQWLLRR